MFALLYRGLGPSSLWPFARPQGRRSLPTARRLVLETLEDRNLLSPTPSPTMGNPTSPTIPAQTAPLTNTTAATVGSSQQVNLALTRQQASPVTTGNNSVAPAPLLSVPQTFLFSNEQTVSSTLGPPTQGSQTFSAGVPFGFQGYQALQNPGVNLRSALGYGVYTQSTLPGLYTVGGGAEMGDLQPNNPPAPPPPPPPPPPRAPGAVSTDEQPLLTAESEGRVSEMSLLAKTTPVSEAGDSTATDAALADFAWNSAPRLDNPRPEADEGDEGDLESLLPPE